MATIAVVGGAVAFDEMPGSPKLSASVEIAATDQKSHLSLDRVGKIPWGSQSALLTELFPNPPSLPGQCPDTARCYAKSVQFEPLSGSEDVPVCSGSVATYEYAKVTIRYETLPYDTSTLISRRWGFSGEFYVEPGGSLYWESLSGGDNVKIQDNEEIKVQKLIPIIDHAITWHRVTTIPWVAIRENIGKVNELLIDDDYFDVPEETLLFVGAEITSTWTADGTQVSTIEYRFQEKQFYVDEESGPELKGWNHFYDKLVGLWRKVWSQEGVGGHNIFELTGDFSDLFT